MGNMTNGFFDTLEAAATWSAGVAFQRSKGLPLDKYSVFETKALAEEYAEKRGAYAETPVSYPGQVIAVAEGDKMVAYVLAESADGTKLELQQIGIIPTGDGKSIEVTADGVISLKGATQATAGQQPRIVNKGTAEEPKLEIEWYTPDNSTVAGLQDTVGAIKETVDGIVEDDGTVTKEGLTHRVNGLETVVGDAESGLVKGLADEIKRAQEAEKALDDAIKTIDFVDKDELADAIEDFETKENVKKVSDDLAGYIESNNTALAGVKATAEAAATKKYTDEELAKKADKSAFEELKGTVDAFFSDEAKIEGTIDTLTELINYIETHDDLEIKDIIDDITAIQNKFGNLNYMGTDHTVESYVDAKIADGGFASSGDLSDLAALVGTHSDRLNGVKDTEKVVDLINAAKQAAIAETTALAEGAVADNTEAIRVLNSDEDGSVNKKVATAKNEAIADTVEKLKNYYTKDEIASLDHATKAEVTNAVAAEAEIARAAEKANADAITAIKDHESVDSFADVVAELAKKQDKLTEGAYATEGYVDGKVKALADGAVAEAKAQADKGVADAKIAKDAADAAQADADTNALNIQEIEKEINGYTVGEGDDIQQVDGLLTKVANNTARIGTLEGTLNGDKGIVAKVNNIINVELPKKANASDLTETNGRVTALENTVNNETTGLVKKVAALDERLTAEESKVDNDTTYTFENGTEGTFKVTAKGGEAQTVDTGAKTYVDNAIKDFATKDEAQGYADAKDEVIAEAKKAGDDAQDAIDNLKTLLGGDELKVLEGYGSSLTSYIEDRVCESIGQNNQDYIGSSPNDGTIVDYVDWIKTRLIGKSSDETGEATASDDTITGAKLYADARKAEVVAMIDGVASAGLTRSVVVELPDPANAALNTIYMIKREAGLNGKDIYDEYILVEVKVEVEGEVQNQKQFELLGNTELDLSNYYTKDETYDKTYIDAYFNGDSIIAWADHATYATNDSNGNPIHDTYETKSDASAKLTEAKGYTDTAKAEAIADASNKAAVVLSEAQKYADGLADNYATAEQGAKADTAIQSVAAGTGLKATVDENDATKVTLDIDDSVVFIFDGGSASSAW